MKQTHVSYAKYGYIFSLPFVITFLFFMLYPLIYTIVIGFTDLRGIGRTDWNFLEKPFDNFVSVLNNNTFRVSTINTFKIWFINFIPQLFLALLLAEWFTNQRHRINAQGIFKVLFFMPNIITAASIAVLFNVLFMFPEGPIQDFLVMLGNRGVIDFQKGEFNFLTNRTASQFIVAFIQFWMWYGYTMLILISGILGLNPSMYEAAEIDGATSVQQFFFITLPNLRTIMIFVLVTSMVGGLNMFDIPRLFNNGMPDNATSTLSLFIFNQAYAGSYLFNRAAAASMIVFIIIAVLSSAVFFLMRDKDAIKSKKYLKQAQKELKLKKAGGTL
ncbi:MAG: sugar ABC transporter permease [Treponema sp.]|nr:sugar ABC transporter permease [Treponema sp.]